MGNIWEILKIEETKDSRAIKRAYAALAKEYNPEEHPEEFLRIREAYERALAYTKGDIPAQAPAEPTGQKSPEAKEEAPEEESSDKKWNFQWGFNEKNPYREHAAVLKFQELYTGKRRRDRTAWFDYFTSDDFLDVWREEGFTSELLNIVRENQENCPPCREFLTDLYLAYGISCQNMQLYLENNAAFNGIENIFEIIKMGPAITRFKGNDPAIAAGFRDYRELLSLALEENWDDAAFLRLGEIVGRYVLYHISDRPVQNAFPYEVHQRHPKSLRLMSHFFAHAQLPAPAYRLLWNHLHLDTATNGKNKLLYGSLRDTVIKRAPEVLEKPRVNYRELNKEYGHFLYYSSHHKNEEPDFEKETGEIDAFFAREDVQYALMDERYVDEQVLHYWINKKGNAYFTHCLEDFFRTHEKAPFRDRVLEVIGEWNSVKKIELEYMEDEQHLPEPGFFDFRKRSYLRYYFNTAFHLAYGVRSNILLPEYLQSHLPYSAAWAKSLTDPEQGGFTPEHPVGIEFGENTLQIIFHKRYLEYRWNGRSVGPLFPWDNLREIQDEAMFWLLLPIANASFEVYPEVYEELLRRLSGLPLCQEDIPVIADCICGKVCRFAEDTENNLPLSTLYRETEEQLYGCDIYRDGMLFLYEESIYDKKELQNGRYQAADMDMAVSMAERLLNELITPCSVKASISQMPDQVFVRNQWNQPSVLHEEQVTGEALQELLEKFFDGKLRRLELSWKVKALVFINDKKQYACLYFDEWKASWYGLVSMPEVYAKVDMKDVVYVPFGLGMLPNYLVHPNLNYMKKRLNDIFDQVACVLGNPEGMMWAPKVYRFEAKLQYHLAKRLYGGYTLEQTRSQLMDRFYIPVLPECISYTDMDNNTSETLSTARNKMAVQDVLSRYMSGKLSKLTLTWQFEDTSAGPEPVFQKRRIILLQDEGKHQMLYVDEKREELEYLVANVNEYLNAEGKKYRKVTFLGKTVPGYLVHEDLIRIRDYLDLLIPQIRYPGAIIGQFGEFSYAGKEK